MTEKKKIYKFKEVNYLLGGNNINLVSLKSRFRLRQIRKEFPTEKEEDLLKDKNLFKFRKKFERLGSMSNIYENEKKIYKDNLSTIEKIKLKIKQKSEIKIKILKKKSNSCENSITCSQKENLPKIFLKENSIDNYSNKSLFFNQRSLSKCSNFSCMDMPKVKNKEKLKNFENIFINNNLSRFKKYKLLTDIKHNDCFKQKHVFNSFISKPELKPHKVSNNYSFILKNL